MPYRPHAHRALSKPKHIHKSQHRSYWPYIPVLLLVISSLLMNTLQPFQKKGVLAYATNTSIDGLLNATNQQRIANNAEALKLSSSLSSAAQSKANDMISRNYWSHNTPDGQEPWIFVSNAGYKYLRAGENLAYGFGTSDDTIMGWMNSTTHRDNMLDGAFTDVGFGFANGQNFNDSGPETVVVAMYGKPQVLAASNQPVTATPAIQEPESQPANLAAPTPLQTPPAEKLIVAANEGSAKPVTTDTPISVEPVTQGVARVQTLTKGKAPWTLFAVGVTTGLAIMFILIKHAAGLRHLIKNGESFVLHHPLLDTILVSFVLMGSILSQTTGFIR